MCKLAARRHKYAVVAALSFAAVRTCLFAPALPHERNAATHTRAGMILSFQI